MDELRAKLYWLMGLRVAAVTLPLVLSLALPLVSSDLVLALSGLIVLTYVLTIAYAIALRILTSRLALIRLSYVQLGIDLALESLLVGSTGGVESPFAVLYVITVTLGSLILGRKGGLALAGVAVVLLGLVTDAQLSGSVQAIGRISPGRLSVVETFHSFGLYALALIVVGFLSGTLAEKLRRADESLVEQQRGMIRLQAFHENVVQSISSGLFTTDSVGRITSFNPAAQEATGYSPRAAQGRFWWEVFTWQQSGPGVQQPGELVAPYRFEAEGRRADGSRLVLGMTLSPLTGQGVQTGLVGVFKDLTQVRDMEEEIRRREWLATLGEMSAGIAHEIRNPLAALGGAMQMLRKDLKLDESNARLMDIAIRETARLDNIIKEFLLYARPPALNLKECDLNTVLSETLDLICHQIAGRTDLCVETTYAPAPMTAQVDPDQMEQVFWNLGANAFQAMPAGGRLSVSTSLRRVDAGERSGEVVEIAFQDTGEGIREQDLDKIFLPFFTTKQEGSGLGLAIVHRIVDLHGGWIRVHSEEGKGSRFVVCVPRVAETGPRLWHEGREPWSRGPWKKS
jgi:two-component system sensor histidine kinase PilS (NtrC family)